jgi:hypothetical protein
MAARAPSRTNLIELLHQASEAEHSLCCQYLYAAFSLRRTPADFQIALPNPKVKIPDQQIKLMMSAAQRWATQIYFVAREEMEHLGIATNMLSAIGERPYLRHGDYPDHALAKILQTEMVLRRCDTQTLERFQFIERPKGLMPGPDPAVETIYLEIKDAFAKLPAAELFRGDGERQINQSDLELGVSMQIVAVTNRASASQAVDLILTQGEGVGASPLSKDTHFAKFSEALQQYRKITQELGIEPSFPMVDNPAYTSGRAGTTQITNPFSRELMQLFDEGYRLMLIMLAEFFWGFRGYAGMFEAVAALATSEQMQAKRRVEILSENAFFPFMTMFIRPVGELLARQPAFDPRDPTRAGPAFSTGGDIPVWTEMDQYLDAMLALQRHTAQLAVEAPDPVTKDALVYLDQNLTRMRLNILNVWSKT